MALGTEDMPPDLLRSDWPETLLPLAQMNALELESVLGIDSDLAQRIAGIMEVHRRLVQWTAPVRPQIKAPEDVVVLMADRCLDPVEHFWTVAMDSSCRVISIREASRGDIDGCEAGPRACLRAVLQVGAVQWIAVHNHPSGDPSPSAADQAVTRRLSMAGKAMDLPLRDHVIITASRDRWCSLRRDCPSLFAG